MTAKDWALVVAILVIIGGGAFIVTKLLGAGKAEQIAADKSALVQQTAQATQQTDTWKERYDSAETAHTLELQRLHDRIAALSLPNKTPSATPVSRLAAPSPSGGTGSALESCQRVLSETAGNLQAELATEFRAAVAADGRAADYRLLYDAYPVVAPPR